MPEFPSAEWMSVYAQTVMAHDRADEVTTALLGRYRFVVSARDGLAIPFSHDLVVAPAAVVAEPPLRGGPVPDVTITAGYGQWRRLLTGEADLLRALLLRRVRISGDRARLTRNATAGGPLLQCLSRVPTTFLH